MSTPTAEPAPPRAKTPGALFDALDIGPVTIKNRVVFGPHTTEFGRDNLPTQRHVDYYEERARGGAGLIITESTYVHPSAKSKPNSVLSCDPGCVPVFGRLAAAVHAHGAKVIGQLSHRGRQMTSAHSGMPVWGVSPLPCPVNRELPATIGDAEIADLLDGYATATDHYRQAGYDGVEIHAAHGYLIEQFWSPWTNRRDDAYGGSLDNRMRFSRMVVEKVRSRCSDGMAVGMRVSADELVAGGLHVEDMIEILARLTSAASLDYVSVSIGTHGSSHVMIGDMTVSQGLVVPRAAQIKQALSVPVLVGLRIKEPGMAAGIIERGDADAVVMVRGLIADPFWPEKARRGDVEAIRYCLGCNQDCRNHHKGSSIGCVQNPAVGREAQLGSTTLTPTPASRHVVVAGGGPAGMETARVAALRGHRVTLFERSSSLGGQVNLATRVGSRQEFGDITRYLVHQMDRLDVDVHLDDELTVRNVEALAPDHVVIATGSRPAPTAVPVARDTGLQWLTVRDVLGGTPVHSEHVLVYDPLEGFWQGCSTAEFLAERGHRVTIVSPLAQIGVDIPKESVRPTFERLHRLGVQMFPMMRVTAVADGAVTAEHVYSGSTTSFDRSGALVTTGSVSDRTLHDRLARALPDLAVHVVGDSVSPRKAGDAIREGHLVGRSI